MTDVAAPNERDPDPRGVPQPRLRDPLLQKAPVILKDLLRPLARVARSICRGMNGFAFRRGEIHRDPDQDDCRTERQRKRKTSKADRNPEAGQRGQVGDQEHDLERTPDAGRRGNSPPYDAVWLTLEARSHDPPSVRPQHRVDLEPQVALERQLVAVNQAPLDACDSKLRRCLSRDEPGYRLSYFDVSEAPRTSLRHQQTLLPRVHLSGEITPSEPTRP
jgi:hypothetical protein